MLALVPKGFAQITVTNAAATLAALTMTATSNALNITTDISIRRLLMYAEAAVRYTVDGTTPSASIGMNLNGDLLLGSLGVSSEQDLRDFILGMKLIRVGGSDVKVNVSFFGYLP